MASSSNVGLTRLPWGRLPISPVTGVGTGLEVSFRDIMAEQQRESGQTQEKDFEEYIENSYVNVGTEEQADTPSSKLCVEGQEKTVPVTEKSFTQLEDLDEDLKMVMSFYEDQDFDDAAYELSEQELDALADDDGDKYYEGLAKKLSTVVELKNSSHCAGNKASRSSLQQQLEDPESLVDSVSKVMLCKLRQKGILRGAFSSPLYKAIHVGKAAIVFHAAGGMLKRIENIALSASTNASILKLRLPKECAIKVFMTMLETSDSFDVIGDGEEEQRQVQAKKEMTNLNRMSRAGIPCPQVQFLYGHILVTDFLGKDGIPAKKLKDANDLFNSRSMIKSAYDQVTNNMKTLFRTCHLVHGNLSENTILWHKRQAYFTNVGSAMNSNRPTALELLYSDCSSIVEFFEKKGKPACQTPQQLFQWITGFDYSGQLLPEACGSDFALV